MSVHENETNTAMLGSKLQSSLDAIKAEAITFKGRTGFFVHHNALDSMSRKVQKIIDEGGEKAPGGVSREVATSMAATIAELRAQSKKSETVLAASKAEGAKASRDIEGMTKSLEAMKMEAAENAKNFSVQKEKLKGELVQAQDKLKELRSIVKTSDVADPNELDHVAAQLENERVKVTDLNNQLQSINAENAKAANRISAYEKDIANYKAACTAAYDRAAKLQALADEAQKSRETLTAIKEIPVTITPEAVKLLGSKAANLLKEAFNSANTVRDQAFHLMIVAKTSSNKKVNSFASLLDQLFKWIKRQAHKVRMAVKPWLDRLAEDLRTGKVKTMMFYREELEKLLKDFQQQKEVKQFKHGYEYKLSRWDDIKIWSRIIFINRPKRIARSTVKSTVSLFKKVKIVVGAFFSTYFRGKDPKEARKEMYSKIAMQDAEQFQLAPSPPGSPPVNLGKMKHVDPSPEIGESSGYTRVPPRREGPPRKINKVDNSFLASVFKAKVPPKP